MFSRNVVIILATVVICGAGAALLVMRTGWFRAVDLNTKIGTRQTHTPKAGETFAAVEDWPKWRGPRGDGISREDAGASWPGKLPQLWAADVGIGYSSPIAADGKIYLFSLNNGKDNLSCFDAQTGNLVWSNDGPTGWNKAGSYEGTRATPAIVGDSIYTYGGMGDVICRDRATGTPRWRQDLSALLGTSTPQWGMASSPLVEDGKVFVQAGQGGPIAVALDSLTGEIAWKSEAAGAGGYASILQYEVEGAKQLAVFAADAVIGMDPATGKTLWLEHWATSYGVNAATPVYRDGHLYVSSAYGKGAMMLKVSKTGATKAWQNGDIKSKFQPPILDGNLLYGNTDQGGVLVCVSWPDGRRLWKADDSAITLKMGGSFVKAAGDKMVTLSEEGMLSLLRVSENGPELLGQFAATGDDIKVWSTPLLYGGRVYVKGPKELVCYDLP